ncbi:hypothetical protein NQ314_011783 [Rhamnusium bicolor]|uniref:Uncharacterized protein n=1 Tax=Rhamnusium bicolor TaxID=1586634 RepID=A0AAV8XF58_9CUCU|nr:hypothetical protein NQ314_011783 [Rhamnusium bicolor]
MEQEKIEREKEIQKLKQQFKLFDLFTRGPQVKKTHSKIPRRHTVGHYGSRLDTIPELSVLPSTYETKLTEELGYDSDVEEGKK